LLVFADDFSIEVEARDAVFERDRHARPLVRRSGTLHGRGILAAMDDKRGLSALHDGEQHTRVGIAKLKYALTGRAAVLRELEIESHVTHVGDVALDQRVAFPVECVNS